MWSGVVLTILHELNAMDGWWKSRAIMNAPPCIALRGHLSAFFRYGIKIMSSERVEIREALQVFMELICDEYVKDK